MVFQNGRPTFQEIPGTEMIFNAELVLLAMGFRGPEKGALLDQLGVDLDARGNVKADHDKMTSVPGVFTAGDMTRGQSLIVWAIAEGRHAAHGVDQYLMGLPTCPGRWSSATPCARSYSAGGVPVRRTARYATHALPKAHRSFYQRARGMMVSASGGR